MVETRLITIVGLFADGQVCHWTSLPLDKFAIGQVCHWTSLPFKQHVILKLCSKFRVV